MNRVAMIAAVVGLSAAPAFAATQSNNAQPANPPVQQSTADHASQPNQQQIDRHQAKLDRRQEKLDRQQAALDQRQMQQRRSGQDQQQAQNRNNAGIEQSNNGQPQNAAMNRNGTNDNQRNWNGNGQASAQPSAYQRHEHAVTQRANRATKALNMLEANGFTQFDNFHRIHPGLFGARVDRDGRWMAVRVDPLDNRIMRG